MYVKNGKINKNIYEKKEKKRVLLVVTVQDSTASYANVDRGSMHVVEHPDDLFSWDKYNNCTFIIILHECTARCCQMWK
jgi:hypothetical protein